jgi:hypothetical protein
MEKSDEVIKKRGKLVHPDTQGAYRGSNGHYMNNVGRVDAKDRKDRIGIWFLQSKDEQFSQYPILP